MCHFQFGIHWLLPPLPQPPRSVPQIHSGSISEVTWLTAGDRGFLRGSRGISDLHFKSKEGVDAVGHKNMCLIFPLIKRTICCHGLHPGNTRTNFGSSHAGNKEKQHTKRHNRAHCYPDQNGSLKPHPPAGLSHRRQCLAPGPPPRPGKTLLARRGCPVWGRRGDQGREEGGKSETYARLGQGRGPGPRGMLPHRVNAAHTAR